MIETRRNGRLKETAFDQQKRKEYGFVIERIKMLPKGAKILDAGCGKGNIVSVLINEGYDAWGVDFLPYMQGHFVPFYHPPIARERYFQEDMRKMHFEDKTFDAIYCLSTLINLGLSAYGEHDWGGEWEDIEAMKELRRVLKDDGIIIITIAYGEPGIRPKRYPYRVYDDDRINMLIQGMEIVEGHYFYFDKEIEEWVETEDKELIKTKFPATTSEDLGNAFLVLRKKKIE